MSPAAAALARGPLHQSTRPQPKVLNRPSANTTGKISVSAQTATASLATAIAVAKGTTAAAAPRRSVAAKTPAPRAIDGSRDSGDRRVVIGVVGAFMVAAAFLMSMNAVSSGDETRAREKLGESFATVHDRQAEYRAIYGRFASWPELQQRGVQIGPKQTVREWNADASHWFISIRDTDTGVICDRTGELFDESAAEREPVCRTLKQP